MRQQAMVWGELSRGYDCWAVRLVSRPANGNVRTIGAQTIAFPIVDIVYGTRTFLKKVFLL
jgi:hypothetical protein